MTAPQHIEWSHPKLAPARRAGRRDARMPWRGRAWLAASIVSAGLRAGDAARLARSPIGEMPVARAPRASRAQAFPRAGGEEADSSGASPGRDRTRVPMTGREF